MQPDDSFLVQVINADKEQVANNFAVRTSEDSAVYTISLDLAIASTYSVLVYLGQTPVSDSPYNNVVVVPGDIAAAVCVASGVGLDSLVFNEEGSFTILARDSANNKVEAALPAGKVFSCTLEGDLYTCNIVPHSHVLVISESVK